MANRNASLDKTKEKLISSMHHTSVSSPQNYMQYYKAKHHDISSKYYNWTHQIFKNVQVQFESSKILKVQQISYYRLHGSGHI
jgi:hypothetical protein